MLKVIWEKKKNTCIVLITITVCMIVLGSILVIDEIQQQANLLNVSTNSLSKSSEQYKAYNVEGMTEQEIQELIKKGRD